MGGDCSQKAHAPEGTAILSGALSASRLNTKSKLYRKAGLHDGVGRGQYRNDRQSGGGQWWRPTRRGIAGRRLIKTMGLGAKPTTALPPALRSKAKSD